MARPHVVVMGGSLGGLNAALWLADAGCDVQVLERSRSPLEGRGAGIVLHPATTRFLTEHGLADLDQWSAPARRLVYLERDGSVAHETPCGYRFAAWTTLYRGMLGRLEPERYHMGSEVVGFDQDPGRVVVHVADHDLSCDLLVAADGVASTARRILLPELEPRYAGYIAWRGTVEEGALSRHTFEALYDVITYHLMASSHILAYPIPNLDGTVTPGERLMNWAWYHNVAEGAAFDDIMTTREGAHQPVSVPPGFVQQKYLDELRRAGARLPPPLAEIVGKTTQPFIQAIMDLEVPRMAFGRVCLIGDAAFALRPHAATGTAKAAEDAWLLAQAVQETEGDVVAALARWEPGQLALGRQVLARTRAAGNRSQFEGTWSIGDPLPFGLYREGDSDMRRTHSP